MNYNNNISNGTFRKSEDDRNNYVRSNNYESNTNDDQGFSKKECIDIEESSNTQGYNHIRNKREVDNNMMANVYDGNMENECHGMNDNNNQNNRNRVNDGRNRSSNNNANGNQENYKKKFGNKNFNNENVNQKNKVGVQNQQKKSGGLNHFMGNNLEKNKMRIGSIPHNTIPGNNNNDMNNEEDAYKNNDNNHSGANNSGNNNFKGDKLKYKPPMLRNQGGMNRNNFNRMNYNKNSGNNGEGGGRGHFGFNNRHYNIPKTAWANRDNRRYYPEKEDEIYSNVKIEKGVNFELYDTIPVEIKGYNSDNIIPIESFTDSYLNLNELLLSNIKKVHYDKTTPIQKYSLSIIMNKHDLIGVAQTGSGKTAGYLLPIINHMLLNDPPKHTFYEDNNKNSNYYYNRVCLPICLILAPTRELAIQIFYDSKKFCFETGIKSVVLYGGSNIKTQLSNLDKGADIIVATPGRLNDILEKGKIRLFLTSFLVLDEADRMLDMGFSPQIKSIVNDYDMPGNDNDSYMGENKMEYKKYTNEIVKRQTIMFSATFRKEIQVLAKDYLCNYTFLLVGKVGSTNEYIKQNLVYSEEENKCSFLLKLLSENSNGLTIIFVETKRKADIIERFLNNQKLNAVCIHGDKSQDERERALELFKRGIKNILVATDVAARGLDISNIKHVINFDLPSNIDDYIHRIGRTGRAGNIGIATSFVNDDNKNIFKDLLATLEECNQEIPRWFLNLVMRYTASAKSNRNYNKYRSMRGGKGNFGRYNNNNNGGDFNSGRYNNSGYNNFNHNFNQNQNFNYNNANMNNENNSPFNNNNSYNQYSAFNTNNSYNNKNHMNGNNDVDFSNSRIYPNNNNHNNAFNNYSGNANPFNNQKFNNYNKRFDDQKFQRGNFPIADDNNNNDGW
ncbi:hypothetical protein YYG_00292 [Plasmodium vinckei petteri]|uniref:RNA helicase n=1 Tax=Plasmodium vinckei petteri TaxID=138298 RepID=W7ALH4_PLAVN|nr:hypothetical protein YYG_00292 [Plasmodium vinckei petteri]CAD2113657.1 ATP-dependent RNA helicase DBP1, putative [Plasmodium vinckei petteri]